MEKKITLLGAGLAGSLLAVLLQKKGFQVTILERRPDARKSNVYAGKSINLAMSMRGWAALEMAGLRKEIEEISIPLYGRQIHNIDGTTIFQGYGKNNEAIYSVSRGELNKKLMTLAEQSGATILFNQRVKDVDLDTNKITLEEATTFASSELNNNGIVIGSDGAFSALRNAYAKKDRFNFSQYYIEHGYKELFIPAGENQTFLIEKNALHIWPRKNYMLIALPNLDGSFTCTLFFPFEGSPSFNSIKSKEDAQLFFETQFADALALMPTLIDDYFANPTSSLVTIKCFPWVHENKSMLIGDAAHAIVPFYGQGMNASFEDCRILLEILETENSWLAVFEKYQQARKKNGDAVAALAMQNFIEMRDLVADPQFLIRKKIEKELGILFPAIFNSVYEMVSFSHTEYHFAMSSQQAQNKLLEKIMAKGDFETNLKNATFRDTLNSWMNEYALEIESI